MNAYEKSLLKYCLTLGGLTQWYDDRMPEDFFVPCVYFPAAYAEPTPSALNSYEARKTIYANVFASTSREAGELAERISDGIMTMRRIIPLLNPDGSDSGITFKVDAPQTSVIDEGVAQITLTYTLFKGYHEEKSEGIAELVITQKIKE